MLISILLLCLPLLILGSKSWYHWQYLREVDHAIRPYANSQEFSRKMIDPHESGIGGIGMSPARRSMNASGLSIYTLLPLFSKRTAFKHSDLANLYARVIYWHLAAFYLSLGLLMSIMVWG